jgi:DUF438 domain-containing protein
MAGTERTQRALLFYSSRPDHNIKTDLVGNMEKLKYLETTVKNRKSNLLFCTISIVEFFKRRRRFGSQL